MQQEKDLVENQSILLNDKMTKCLEGITAGTNRTLIYPNRKCIND
jgi:hypothetical protein